MLLPSLTRNGRNLEKVHNGIKLKGIRLFDCGFMHWTSAHGEEHGETPLLHELGGVCL